MITRAITMMRTLTAPLAAIACCAAIAQAQPASEPTWAAPDLTWDRSDSTWAAPDSTWDRSDSVWANPDSAWANPDSVWANPDSAWKDTDEAWRELEKMDPNDIDFDELAGNISRGWFPRAQPASALSLFGEVFYADVHDRGSDIRSRALAPTTAPFGWRNPFTGDERAILDPFSDDEAEDSYPVTDYTEYGVGYTYNLPMPAVARLGASLQVTEGMLFAGDTTRSYLALSGVRRPLKEVGVVYLKNYALTAAGGIDIPIYGAFVDSELGTISSYYYVYLGGSASYVIASRATQYQQIATPKSELRYGNGSDTVTLISHRRLDGLDRMRTAIDVALGWNFAAEFFAFSFEAFLSIPQTTVLLDAPWRQYYAGFRSSIGYQWLPGR